ncbi:hypothetical protein M011DRAFT_99724 [Sporormia fimetaria CBS 119925]|uniref:Uncharacterized protein n=1 Tax=Sporormia fimetaria CBS 119925 TaxID=1340428 RepID=A0A6A6VAI2_9PLEO|nr:hypothetical protein M011DRAFT_99724 [Sporormia fimetaria CBS 119925]
MGGRSHTSREDDSAGQEHAAVVTPGNCGMASPPVSWDADPRASRRGDSGAVVIVAEGAWVEGESCNAGGGGWKTAGSTDAAAGWRGCSGLLWAWASLLELKGAGLTPSNGDRAGRGEMLKLSRI